MIKWCALHALLVLVPVVGCGGGGSGGHADGASDSGGDDRTASACETFAQTFTPSADIDLLVVVDNSASMESEQARLNAAIDVLIGSFADTENGFRGAHLGVVSTDMGTGPYLGVGCMP
ncbi:MAG: hypothetical protein ACREOF_10655, partial [Gemmatimonadales bacterium]